MSIPVVRGQVPRSADGAVGAVGSDGQRDESVGSEADTGAKRNGDGDGGRNGSAHDGVEAVVGGGGTLPADASAATAVVSGGEGLLVDGDGEDARGGEGETAEAVAAGGRSRGAGEDGGHRPSLWQRFEAFVGRLSTRNNFWHKVCSWIWLPFAYRSGIRMKQDKHDGSAFSAVLPFRRFNRNWYSAMAGAALLGNSEIAGGAYVFKQCGGKYRVVCKQLSYRFLRPCVGPAMYRMTPRQDIKALVATGEEFNVVLDMEVVQVMRTPLEKERRVGRCEAAFHATPISLHERKQKRRRRPGRKRWRR